MKTKNGLNEKIKDELTNEKLNTIPADLIDQQIEIFADLLIDYYLNDIYESKSNKGNPAAGNSASQPF